MNLDADTLRILGIVKDSFFPLLIAGVKFTIPVTVVSFMLGSIVAMVTALARLSKHKLLNLISSFYVWIIRGTPLLVQLFILFAFAFKIFSMYCGSKIKSGLTSWKKSD